MLNNFSCPSALPNTNCSERLNRVSKANVTIFAIVFLFISKNKNKIPLNNIHSKKLKRKKKKEKEKEKRKKKEEEKKKYFVNISWRMNNTSCFKIISNIQNCVNASTGRVDDVWFISLVLAKGDQELSQNINPADSPERQLDF